MTDPEKFLPLRETVLGGVRTAILSGQFAPTERLIEFKIAEELGVSRTPVREALRRLEQEGIVERVRGGGLAVASPQLAEILEVYAVRAPLEGLAARLAAEHGVKRHATALRQCLKNMERALAAGDDKRLVGCGTEFHAIITQAAANTLLTEVLDALRVRVTLYLYRLATRIEIPWEEQALDEHRVLAEAIIAHRVDEAERLGREHVHRALKHLTSSVDGDGGGKG